MALTSPLDTLEDPDRKAAGLDGLWETEFGDTPELVIRILGISGGGTALWIYNGMFVGPIWAVTYLTLLLLNFCLLRPHPNDAPRREWACYSTFALSLCAYLTLPVYLMFTGDPVLVLCATIALIAYAIFALFRPSPPGILGYLDYIAGWALSSMAAFAFVPLGTSLFPKIVIGFLCLTMALYFSMTVRRNRDARAQFQMAARRSLEAQKMEAIGRLSGGIAHDFNNILTVLQGSLELYHEVPEGPERDALVDEARAAGMRATALVSQLLSFARKAPLAARAHDANAVIEELCTLAKRLLPVSIHLQHRMTETPIQVLADANGLHSALLNLILNANDAMDGRGSITVAVDLMDGPAPEAGAVLAQVSEGAHLRFRVTDDGPGMPAEVEQRAMEPFFTTKPVGKGSGLGLPMAMGFAEQSGGALKIQTGPDGTTVSIHLPLDESARRTDDIR